MAALTGAGGGGGDNRRRLREESEKRQIFSEQGTGQDVRKGAPVAMGPRIHSTPSRKHETQEEKGGSAPSGGMQPFFFFRQRTQANLRFGRPARGAAAPDCFLRRNEDATGGGGGASLTERACCRRNVTRGRGRVGRAGRVTSESREDKPTSLEPEEGAIDNGGGRAGEATEGGEAVGMGTEDLGRGLSDHT